MSTLQTNNPTVSIELDPDNQPGVFTVIPELTGSIDFDKETIGFDKASYKGDYTVVVNYTTEYGYDRLIYRALRKYLMANRLGSDKTKRLRKKKYMSRYHDEITAKIASMRATGKAR